MERLKIGIIGLGQRGYSMAQAEFTRMTDKFDVVAVCDMYDAAVYVAVTALSEESIAKGSAPVFIPDSPPACVSARAERRQ